VPSYECDPPLCSNPGAGQIITLQLAKYGIEELYTAEEEEDVGECPIVDKECRTPSVKPGIAPAVGTEGRDSVPVALPGEMLIPGQRQLGGFSLSLPHSAPPSTSHWCIEPRPRLRSETLSVPRASQGRHRHR